VGFRELLGPTLIGQSSVLLIASYSTKVFALYNHLHLCIEMRTYDLIFESLWTIANQYIRHESQHGPKNGLTRKGNSKPTAPNLMKVSFSI
jgi:hypothetical protein